MTEPVQINRFQLKDDGVHYRSGRGVSIIDYQKYQTIVEIMTDKQELNIKIGEIVLEELNKEYQGKKE